MRDLLSEIALLVLVAIAIVAIGFGTVKTSVKNAGNTTGTKADSVNTSMNAAW